MLHFYDRAGFSRALMLDLEPRLHNLLSHHIEALTDELMDYTEYLVVQPGDIEADIVRHVGLSPLIEPTHGSRYGMAGFHPHWDWLVDHDGWYEMIVTFGGAFAYVLLIQDVDGVPDELRALCREFSRT